MRNFQKIKEIQDYNQLDAPELVSVVNKPDIANHEELMVLRMLVRPKYGKFIIPESLKFLEETILELSAIDVLRTGIEESWCYVTIRHGEVKSETDDEWHFDGSSFRTDIIPERNYIWVDNNPTEYKEGNLSIPEDFDPINHNLFTFAEHQLKDNEIKTCEVDKWYLLSPFCLHRRPDIADGTKRTFYRICFTDIEGRDINNTPNPLLHTEFYGRNPVQSFRNKLKDYYKDNYLKISKRKFKKWVESCSDEHPTGTVQNSFYCPVSNYLKSINHIGGIEYDEDVDNYIFITGEKEKQYKLPKWVKKFIKRIDKYPTGSNMSKKTTLEILENL